MPPKKVRPYEKAINFLEHYERQCRVYDVPILEQVKEVYDPVIQKKGKKIPNLFQFVDDEVVPTQIAPFIEAYQKSEHQVKYLSFMNTQSGDDGLRIVAKGVLPPMELIGISYCGNGVTPVGCRSIARQLVNAKSLAILELDFNGGIGDLGAAAFASFVHGPALSKLSLKYCGIGDEGAAALGRWIAKPSCKITELYLNGNHIGPAGAMAFGEKLGGNRSLVTLDLSDNVFGFDTGALDALIEGIRRCLRLQNVYLLNNFECPEGYDQKFRELVAEKPLGEFVFSCKMDSLEFQNVRAIAIANKKKLGRENSVTPEETVSGIEAENPDVPLPSPT